MKIKHLVTITIFIFLSNIAKASCFGYTKPEQQPTSDVKLEIYKNNWENNSYTIKVIKKSYHLDIKIESMTLIQKSPYLRVETIIHPMNYADEAIAEGKGFSPNNNYNSNKEDLLSYIEFTVADPKEIDNYEVQISYGWSRGCGTAFQVNPVAKLQYNKALKKDAASGAL